MRNIIKKLFSKENIGFTAIGIGEIFGILYISPLRELICEYLFAAELLRLFPVYLITFGILFEYYPRNNQILQKEKGLIC